MLMSMESSQSKKKKERRKRVWCWWEGAQKTSSRACGVGGLCAFVMYVSSWNSSTGECRIALCSLPVKTGCTFGGCMIWALAPGRLRDFVLRFCGKALEQCYAKSKKLRAYSWGQRKQDIRKEPKKYYYFFLWTGNNHNHRLAFLECA